MLYPVVPLGTIYYRKVDLLLTGGVKYKVTLPLTRNRHLPGSNTVEMKASLMMEVDRSTAIINHHHYSLLELHIFVHLMMVITGIMERKEKPDGKKPQRFQPLPHHTGRYFFGGRPNVILFSRLFFHQPLFLAEIFCQSLQILSRFLLDGFMSRNGNLQPER